VDASQVRELVAYLSEAQTLASLDTPRGILLTGPPGRGKTMCLDAWYEALPVRGKFRRVGADEQGRRGASLESRANAGR
jgi:protein AFG1